MIRSLRLVALAVALALAGTGCWMEVPNLDSTGGGYAPGMAATSGTEPGHEASSPVGGPSETSVETSEAETPAADRDST
ncbi:MAG: hypothetical protein ACREMK_08775 [Gemmatimonadota bacterium]